MHRAAARDSKTTRLIDGARTSQGSAGLPMPSAFGRCRETPSVFFGSYWSVVIPAALPQRKTRPLPVKPAVRTHCRLRVGAANWARHAADLSCGLQNNAFLGRIRRGSRHGTHTGFDGATMRNAIGLAANFAVVCANTLMPDRGSPFQAGFAARNGVYVADLAVVRTSIYS